MQDLRRAPRLHLEERLEAGLEVALGPDRAHQLRHVLRLGPGARLRLFNAACGEWRAELVGLDRRGGRARIDDRLRPPAPEPGPRLAVAPIRANRLDWLVEKAVELGVGDIDLVLARRTVVRPDRIDRLAAIAVEAAEQCGRLSVPAVRPALPLPAWLDRLPAEAPLVVADETGGEAVLPLLRALPGAVLLVGPEGGFDPAERQRLLARPGSRPASLGPRVLRSETAALALLVAAGLAREPARPDRPADG